MNATSGSSLLVVFIIDLIVAIRLTGHAGIRKYSRNKEPAINNFLGRRHAASALRWGAELADMTHKADHARNNDAVAEVQTAFLTTPGSTKHVHAAMVSAAAFRPKLRSFSSRS
eukprot:6191205-Pleurochrysis_carterae.AAC.5